jgi:hypothetical protein
MRDRSSSDIDTPTVAWNSIFRACSPAHRAPSRT